MYRFFALLLLCSTACTPVPSKNNASAAQHRQWASELLSIRDLKGATEEMRLALAGNPNIEDALLYADLLESQKRYKDARNVYRKAGSYPADNTQKEALAYRLAIVEATDLDNLREADKLREVLPPVDSRYFDLQALLLLKRGDFKEALEAGEKALVVAANNEQKGWAYYHLARIYYELRVERDTFGSLFKAINNTRGHGLMARITEYWESIRHSPFPTD